MLDKELFGYLSLFFTLLSILPYIWNMVKGRTKPHVFSWIIWLIACTIVTAAQFTSNAGAGAWATGMSALLCFIIVLLSLTQKADWSITKSDSISFSAALTIIPLWYFTESAMIAAILATLIDALAYYPTIRKSWHRPHEEMIFSYFVANLKHGASIFAMSAYTVTTLSMPVTMFIMNGLLIIILVWRRKI